MFPNFQFYGCELMKLPFLQKRHLNWPRKITHCYSRTANQKLRQSI